MEVQFNSNEWNKYFASNFLFYLKILSLYSSNIKNLTLNPFPPQIVDGKIRVQLHIYD